MRSVIKKDRVHLIEGPPTTGATSEGKHAATHRGERTARLVRVDGTVHAIEFRCSCGELSVLELEYGPESEMNS